MSAIEMAAFIRPQDAQASSRLLQLPAELILIVVRLLLGSPEPIKSLRQCEIQNDLDDVLFQEVLGLSAQLLRCCQYLHAVGKKVLYEENTVVIYFDSDIYDEGSCHVLDTTTTMPEHSLDVPAVDFNLLSWCRKRLSQSHPMKITSGSMT